MFVKQKKSLDARIAAALGSQQVSTIPETERLFKVFFADGQSNVAVF
jgi:hypothetical protein